jgi:hypothetical protein
MRRPRALLWELPLIVLFFLFMFLAVRRGLQVTPATDRMRERFEGLVRTSAIARIASGSALPTVDLAPARSLSGGWDVHVVLQNARWPGESSGSGSRAPTVRVLLFTNGEFTADADKSPVHVGTLGARNITFAAVVTDEHHKALSDGTHVSYRIITGSPTPDGFAVSDKR